MSPSLFVACYLLHLITLPVLKNSLLKQFYNPVLTTVADNLDMQSLCEAIAELDPHNTHSVPQVGPWIIVKEQTKPLHDRAFTVALLDSYTSGCAHKCLD